MFLDGEEEESLLTPPKGCCKRLVWVIMLPASLLMVVTIPDFRRGGCWERLYLMTFIVSVAWIGGLCYVMVWMVSIIGSFLFLDNIEERGIALQMEAFNGSKYQSIIIII